MQVLGSLDEFEDTSDSEGSDDGRDAANIDVKDL